MSTIDEGIEVLTGVRAGREKKDGTFPKYSVHGRVKARLKKLMEDSARLRKELSGDSEKDSSGKGPSDEEDLRKISMP